MPRHHRQRFIVLLLVAVTLVVNAVFFGGRIVAWVTDMSAGGIGAAGSAFTRARSVVTLTLTRTDLAARVRDLEDEVARLGDQATINQELRAALDAYRQAAGVSTRPVGPAIEAGIFSYHTQSGVRQAVINRGTDDGVSIGDVVVTIRGELAGVVLSVAGRHAVVGRLQDAAFEVTARVGGTGTTGLIRATGDGSLFFDLIRKDETVAETAAVITSGDDAFPPGLTIGAIRSVDSTAPTLFQIVKVEPAVPDDLHGRVLIIHP